MRTTQKARVYEILSDMQPHSTFEIMDRLYPSGKAGLFRLAAIIHAMKREGRNIRSWKDKEIHNKHWYHLVPANSLF